MLTTNIMKMRHSHQNRFSTILKRLFSGKKLLSYNGVGPRVPQPPLRRSVGAGPHKLLISVETSLLRRSLKVSSQNQEIVWRGLFESIKCK